MLNNNSIPFWSTVTREELLTLKKDSDIETGPMACQQSATVFNRIVW